jgi:E3 ubiquitin-protein ligase BRE1
MLSRRDNDLARLREQRDQQAAELNERRHKDSVKFTSTQELKSLVDAQKVRNILPIAGALLNCCRGVSVFLNRS